MADIILTQQEFEARTYRYQGLDLINDTNEHTGDWISLKILEEATIDTMITDSKFESLAGIKLSATDSILIDFTSIKLSKGIVLAYKRGLKL
jgi:hypothetical protein